MKTKLMIMLVCLAFVGVSCETESEPEIKHGTECGIVSSTNITIDNLGYNTYWVNLTNGKTYPVSWEDFANSYKGREVCIEY